MLSSHPILSSTESEREELEAVLTVLARTPRLAKLLRFLADTYFAGESDRITEYNIATEVFNRKKTDFIASEDAIARVETHRLRKRLRAFYEGEGIDHSVQISIPSGSYIPVFTLHRVQKAVPLDRVMDDGVDALAGDASSTENKDLLQDPAQDLPWKTPLKTGTGMPATRFWRRFWLNGLGAIAALALVFLGYRAFRARDRNADTPNGSSSHGLLRPGSVATEQRTAQVMPIVAVPFRLIAGYTGAPQIDSNGSTWQGEKYFSGGWPVRQSASFIAGTSNPLIFRYGRLGDFSYNVPLKPGAYELHLYFMQPTETDQSEDAENKAVFNVAVNGKIALDSLDIVSDAMGRNVADERVVRDVSPGSDGILHIRLSTVVGTPSLSAIEILEGVPNEQRAIRIVTQATSLTDRGGHMWQADNYFIGGRRISHSVPVARQSDGELLSTERYGHFTYSIPVDARDRYSVTLSFVELFFGEDGLGGGGAGSRTFRVLCNGTTLLEDFDIYKEAGAYHMVKKTFYHLKPTAQGKLNLTFEPVSNYATVSALEVSDESH